jgi:hypothetical protein
MTFAGVAVSLNQDILTRCRPALHVGVERVAFRSQAMGNVAA